MAYETIIVDVEDHICLIRLNRPDAMNALNDQLLNELAQAMKDAQSNDKVRCIVLTGSEKAFAAGADIKMMSDKTFTDVFAEDLFGPEIDQIARVRKPIIGAVAGYALGGGCELAMMCDFLIAADTAKFGQPEINLGIIPGFGGTQRLPRLVGKGMAKELCMTGALISAREAKEIGLVNKVFPADKLWEGTMKTAKVLASKGRFSLMAVKRCIDRGYDLDLRAACAVETDRFGLCMASPDGREGMTAFLEKRKPDFRGELT